TATHMGSAAYGRFNLAQFKMYNIPLNNSDIAQEYQREKKSMSMLSIVLIPIPIQAIGVCRVLGIHYKAPMVHLLFFQKRLIHL
ncbi:hypothetical protein ACI3PL_26990, partial [Lacticaseibacillus paracasei]